MTDQTHNSIGHETQDADVRAIVYTGIGLAISAGLVIVLVYGIFRYLADHPPTTAPDNPLSETDRQQFPPAPRIEEHPAMELKDLRSQEDRILTTYGWVDQKSGVVRIPIDRAIELQLQRGFPTRQEAAKK
jgi:hypothetical protein